MTNVKHSFTGGTIAVGDLMFVVGGFDDTIFADTNTVEKGELVACMAPTPCPPTPTPTPPCGLVIGDGVDHRLCAKWLSAYLPSNIVNYTFSSSVSAPNDYAIFETHDPWGFTVVKDAITAAGHTYTVFTPADLAGFDFSQYRVVILNWDDTFLSDFGGNAACGGGVYISALPALETYSAGGGVVWVQGAIQGNTGDCFPLPFGGQACWDPSPEDPIADQCSPEVIGVSNPIEGTFASHAATRACRPPHTLSSSTAPTVIQSSTIWSAKRARQRRRQHPSL